MKKFHKHIGKHKKHYARFVAFFLMLLAMGVIQDLTVQQLVHGEIFFEAIVIAIIVAFLFTLVAEATSKLFGTHP